MLVYENKNYQVVYESVYKVVNKDTGAIEDSSDVLPKALMSAHTYNDAIERFHQRRKEETQNNVVSIGSTRKDDSE